MGVGGWIGVIVAVIVVVALIALAVGGANKKKKERNRARAAELREQAASQANVLQQREAEARETEARAAQARAEAERRQAEAERLEAEARDRSSTLDEHRTKHAEHLRQADELDPDVKHEAPRTDHEVPPDEGSHRGVSADGTAAEVPEQRVDEPGTHRA